MDLTSLSTTLPRSHASHTTDDPEEPSSSMLLAAFKQTALSVTTLYKTAANETERSRREGRTEGYQDCLDDLLAFVEKVEGRSDAKTLEMLRQWALSKRRKAGKTPTTKHPRPDREESADEPDTEEMQNAEEPTTATMPMPLQNQNMNITMKSPPRPQPAPAFAFRSNVDLPRHIPPPPKFDNDVEITDTDLCSPPTSPAHSTIFQTRTMGAPAPSMAGSTGRHTPQRAGNKRRLGSLGDFFDIAGMEKMQLEQKRRRHQ